MSRRNSWSTTQAGPRGAVSRTEKIFPSSRCAFTGKNGRSGTAASPLLRGYLLKYFMSFFIARSRGMLGNTHGFEIWQGNILVYRHAMRSF